MNDLLNTLARERLKADLPEIRPGDTVRVSVRVVEGNRERLQNFEGTVLRVRNGGLDKQITVRRVGRGGGGQRGLLGAPPPGGEIERVRHGHPPPGGPFFLPPAGRQAPPPPDKARVIDG